jgi:hypothetical protein
MVMAGQAIPYAQAVAYIACDVPEGMRLATWRKAAEQPRRKHRRMGRSLRRPR